MDYLKTWLTFNKSNESINESRIESNESINKSNEEITQLETPIETLIQRVVDEFVNIDNISACLLSSIITHIKFKLSIWILKTDVYNYFSKLFHKVPKLDYYLN